MKYICEVEYPDECGRNWMNSGNLQLCIDAYCENKDGRIKVRDYPAADYEALESKLARLVDAAENFVISQELVNTEGEKELISRSARPLIILLDAFNKLKSALEAAKVKP